MKTDFKNGTCVKRFEGKIAWGISYWDRNVMICVKHDDGTIHKSRIAILEEGDEEFDKCAQESLRELWINLFNYLDED